MLHKQKLYLKVFTLVTVVLFSQSAPAFAQDLGQTDNPAIVAAEGQAPTEIGGETSGTLDEQIVVEAASPAKVTVQESEKAVPAESDSEMVMQDKLDLFLPSLGSSTTGNAADAPLEAQAYWRTLKYETFEGAFPNGLWRTYDCNGTSYGQYYWDDDDYKPYSGRWSAWPANGGINARDPQYYYYPNNACTWMIYGPVNLWYARAATLNFKYWNQSERNYDYFSWMVSRNGTNFYGYRTSGDSGGWRNQTLNLASIPTLGSALGDSSVWIAFRFTSDGSVVDDGPFVDNVLIQEYR